MHPILVLATTGMLCHRPRRLPQHVESVVTIPFGLSSTMSDRLNVQVKKAALGKAEGVSKIFLDKDVMEVLSDLNVLGRDVTERFHKDLQAGNAWEIPVRMEYESHVAAHSDIPRTGEGSFDFTTLVYLSDAKGALHFPATDEYVNFTKGAVVAFPAGIVHEVIDAGPRAFLGPFSLRSRFSKARRDPGAEIEEAIEPQLCSAAAGVCPAGYKLKPDSPAPTNGGVTGLSKDDIADNIPATNGEVTGLSKDDIADNIPATNGEVTGLSKDDIADNIPATNGEVTGLSKDDIADNIPATNGEVTGLSKDDIADNIPATNGEVTGLSKDDIADNIPATNGGVTGLSKDDSVNNIPATNGGVTGLSKDDSVNNIPATNGGVTGLSKDGIAGDLIEVGEVGRTNGDFIQACCEAISTPENEKAGCEAAFEATPPFVWETKAGCCRERKGKATFTHHRTAAKETLSPATKHEALTSCTATCDENDACTAVEVTAKNKATSVCEFHTSPINSATRASKSCKKALCKIKAKYVAPCVQTVSPTSAPAAEPTPASAWTEKRGCCRQVKGKNKYSHQDTAQTPAIEGATSFSAAAVECKQLCDTAKTCTAVEIRQQKKKRRAFRCELHFATINSATRASKSCKKATCSIKA